MNWITDANTAVANIAYQLSEVIAVYPITPSTTMAECCEAWSAKHQLNILGETPEVIEMQSEAGTIAVVHGSAMSGALATTFTSSQGLLLMIPTLYKLVGELTPCVIHVAARSVATHALSIFCDHSDVMSIRQTGVAMLCASNGQQAQDMALISTMASLRSRLPFVHFFDGFITSHTLTNIDMLTTEQVAQLFPHRALLEFRQRALTPDRPTLRGATAGPDTYFQCREAQNRYQQHAPDVVQTCMDEFAQLTGRAYHLVEYCGHPQATRVIIALGSVSETLNQYVQSKPDESVGVVTVHLYRPFPTQALLNALPESVQQISVLDRTKEPGSSGEPLYLDVLDAIYQSGRPIELFRGRYGLSGKAFFPEDAQHIFAMMRNEHGRKREFVVGIDDDVTHLSLPVTSQPEREEALQTVLMYGYGGDGSISAGKNVLKALGKQNHWYVNAQFEYDSKKSRNLTTTHLRLSEQPIQTPYPIRQARLISLSQLGLLKDIDITQRFCQRALLLINTSLTGQALWDSLPFALQSTIQAKQIKVVTIDADKLSAQHQLKNKASVAMQVAATLLLSPSQEPSQQRATLLVLQAMCKTQLQGKPDALIERNLACIEAAAHEINDSPFTITAQTSQTSFAIKERSQPSSLVEWLLAGKGGDLPVSAYPADGIWPTNTSSLEKRDISEQLPVWDPDLCTQCGYCVSICPHSAIRARVFEPNEAHQTSTALKTMSYRSRHQQDAQYALQVSPDDCTGCQLCAQVCPAKDKRDPEQKALTMVSKPLCYEQEQQQFAQFNALPMQNIHQQSRIDVKTIQHVEPYFEYPNACAGCGETPYIRILTQLFGDRLYIANATGCSSIFGGNLPTTPYSQDAQGRGPAWANSLFEDNAEFGLGMRLAVKALGARAQTAFAQHSLHGSNELLTDVDERRQQLSKIKSSLTSDTPHAELKLLLDYLIEKQVWLIGGDGWAYDIGFGGLDHVLRSGENINILVLDTQCYANTGGQKSKSTPQGKTAKLCSLPNPNPAKDLVALYQNLPGIYVARIALAANMNHTIKTLQAAGEHKGPSLVVAYSPCIEHHYDLAQSAEYTKALVKQGDWPLYAALGKNVE